MTGASIAIVGMMKDNVVIVEPNSMFEVAKVIDVSYYQALKSAKRYLGGGGPFTSPELNQMARAGRIFVRPIGPTVYFQGREYAVEQASIPVAWTSQDDENADTENKRVQLAYDLMKNAWQLHDDMLLQQIGAHKAVVSKEYLYKKGDINRMLQDEGDKILYMFRVFTAFAVVD